jgi:hypothetical protein
MGAVVFIVLMSRVQEPIRRTLNAVIAAGATGVYLNGGFGAYELIYPVLALPLAYRGLASYRYIGILWLTHAAWDLPHHLWGTPIWPFMPTSSFGCFIFDTLISLWLFAGAPTIAPVKPSVRTP